MKYIFCIVFCGVNAIIALSGFCSAFNSSIDTDTYLALRTYTLRHPSITSLPSDIILPIPPCELIDANNSLVVSPGCLLHIETIIITGNDRQDIIERNRSNVSGFDTFYELNKTEFSVQDAKPLFHTGMESVMNIFHSESTATRLLLYGMHRAGIWIRLDQRVRDMLAMRQFAYYPVRKSMIGIGKCGATNYLIGFRELDSFILRPGKPFNLNAHIAYLPGYCAWDGPDYMFNGGACGISTQVFRTSLMHPSIMTRERNNHSKRRAYYYGNYIYGDDAAIYENSRRLIIENIGSTPILFKTIEREDETYLVTISPRHPGGVSTIFKNQTGPLTSLVRKVVTDTNNNVLYREEFSSVFKTKYMNP